MFVGYFVLRRINPSRSFNAEFIQFDKNLNYSGEYTYRFFYIHLNAKTIMFQTI